MFQIIIKNVKYMKTLHSKRKGSILIFSNALKYKLKYMLNFLFITLKFDQSFKLLLKL